MAVVVFGDRQAVSVAGYVAAHSGRQVHLGNRPEEPIRAVLHGGSLVEIELGPASALPGAGDVEAAILVAESRDLESHLHPVRHLLSGRPLLLAPGGFGGVLRVLDWFEAWGLEPPRVAETTGFPVAGTVRDGVLTPHTIKRGLPMASVGVAETAELHAVFAPLLPGIVASDLATTSLSNTNHMIHPGVVVLNAVRIQNGEPFRLYRNGLSPAVGRLIDAVDGERRSIARRIGAADVGVRDWMVHFYAEEGMAGDGIVECLQTFANFERVASPPGLDHRYLLDDVPYGLAQWADLARDLDIDVPHIEGLLSVLQTLAPRSPLGADARTARLFQQFLSTSQGAML